MHFKHNSYTSNEYLVKILLYLGVGILYSQLKLIQDTRYILVNLIAFLADNQISANILLPPHYKLSYVVLTEQSNRCPQLAASLSFVELGREHDLIIANRTDQKSYRIV